MYPLFFTKSLLIHFPLFCFILLSQVGAVPIAYNDEASHPDSLIHRELDEVVVSAQRTPVLRSEAMRSIQVIDHEQIRGSSAHDLVGLLAAVRSVDIRSRGTFGMQADVSIRGGTFDQTLVLLNGVNITDPQTGHHNLNVPVDLQSIERIEILHGSGARIFGPNAFNGAINIITKEPGDANLNASLSGGQHRFGSAGLSTGFSSGPVNHHLSLSGMTSDGFIDNTDFRTGNLFYRSRLAMLNGTLDLQGGYNEKAFGANSFYTPRFPDQFEHTRTGFASLRWLPGGSIRLTPSVYWRRHHDRFELFRHEAPEWYTGHNYHRTDIVGASLNWVHVGALGTSSAGLDYRYEHIFSNVLGEELTQPVRISHEDDAFFTHSYSRNGISLMLEHSFTHGPFSLAAGTLIYTNSDLDDPFTLFPGIDAGWQFHNQWRWYASANRTLRLPTFTDLFYSGPDNLGNPLLVPEEAVSLESGVKGTWRFVQFETAVFRRWGTNMIDWVRRPQDDVWRSDNLTEVTLTGFEAGATVVLGSLYSSRTSTRSSSSHSAARPTDRLSSSGSTDQTLSSRSSARSTTHSADRLISVQYARIHAGKSSGDFISNYALDYLRHKVDIVLAMPITNRTGVHTTAIWQDRAGSFLLYEDGEFTEIRDYEPFWRFNLKLYYDIGPTRFFGEASNLLDVRHADIGNVPQPGRWLRGGIEIEIR